MSKLEIPKKELRMIFTFKIKPNKGIYKINSQIRKDFKPKVRLNFQAFYFSFEIQKKELKTIVVEERIRKCIKAFLIV